MSTHYKNFSTLFLLFGMWGNWSYVFTPQKIFVYRLKVKMEFFGMQNYENLPRKYHYFGVQYFVIHPSDMVREISLMTCIICFA